MSYAPFLTIYTPTYRRPKALGNCLASVQGQTAVADIEHLVIPDHVGLGVGGMYQRVPLYADAVHGRYVHLMADDDVLASPHAVETVKAFAEEKDYPDVIVVRAIKGPLDLPLARPWPPILGQIDLGCILTLASVWKTHCGAYGRLARYEGDYDFAEALFLAGVRAEYCPVLFLVGGVNRGAIEEVSA